MRNNTELSKGNEPSFICHRDKLEISLTFLSITMFEQVHYCLDQTLLQIVLYIMSTIKNTDYVNRSNDTLFHLKIIQQRAVKINGLFTFI